MRIGFFISQILYGGAEMVLVNLANEFAGNHYNVVLITNTREDLEPEVDGRIRRYVLAEEPGKSYLPNAINNQLRLRRIIHEQHLDVVVAFMGGALFHGVLATIGTKAKSIISIRNDPAATFKTLKKRILAKTVLPMASFCVFQTEQAREWFPRKLQNKSIVIPNGIKTAFFEAEYEPNEKIILTCGRLEPQKNQSLLVSAVKSIVKNHEEIKLVIVGEGSLYGELSKQVKALGLENHVTFAGATTNIIDYYRKSGIFVLPSNYEGIPNVLLEALAVGVPSVATDCPCGGPRMLIRNGVNGLLVPMADQEKMQEAIELILNSKKVRETLMANARESVRKFEFSNVVEQWIRVVNECVEKHVE